MVRLLAVLVLVVALPAQATRAALPASGELNPLVLEVALGYPADGTHRYHWPKSGPWKGCTRDLVYAGELLAAGDPEGRAYCCGLTFEVFFEAWRRWCEQRGQPFRIGDLDLDGVRRLQRQWFGSADDPSCLHTALVANRLGRRITDRHLAEPGDFVQLWRADGSGHSVVFLGWVRDADGISGLRYWSTQTATDGIGERVEWFGERGGARRLDPERIWICRVGAGERDERLLTYAGDRAAPAHRKVVFVTGDEEYRSEEAMPQIARIVTEALGHTSVVLFAIDPETGHIDPDQQRNIPGLHHLEDADLLVIFTRFRDLPDAQMVHLQRYLDRGGPIVGLRTATHAFRLGEGSAYRHWSTGHRGEPSEWQDGFGRAILGETWIAHHGEHGRQSTRGVAVTGRDDDPILRGIAADGLGPAGVWDPADVYRVRLPLPAGCEPLLLGIVLDGMTPDAAPAAPREGAGQDPNDPAMPVAWTREMPVGDRGVRRVFTTTIGSSQAFLHEGSRRLIVNAVLWALGQPERITADLDVSLRGAFEPSRFGFGGYRRKMSPADFRRQ